MRKFRLHLEQLHVDSFMTTSKESSRSGSVFAADSEVLHPETTETGEDGTGGGGWDTVQETNCGGAYVSCDTCPYTCPTCGSCVNTCGFTCGATCGQGNTCAPPGQMCA